jgi:hypothetical protein
VILMTRCALGAAVLLMGVWAGRAEAQNPPVPSSRSLVPARFPRWDLTGSLGMLNIATTDTNSSWRGWDQKFEYRADLGRYWTTHLRSELAVGTSNGWEDFEVAPLPVAGVQAPVYAYTDIERRLTTVAPAVTWQFRENTFMHPYVTGGVKVGFLQEHRLRTPDAYRFGPQGLLVPPLDERSTTVLARPFVAGGFKSYISRSAFVRTEGRVAAGSTGPRQVSLLVGIGFDF